MRRRRFTVLDWAGFQQLYSVWGESYGSNDTVVVQVISGPDATGEFELGVELDDAQHRSFTKFLRDRDFEFREQRN